MRLPKQQFAVLIFCGAALVGCGATETSENTPHSVPDLPLVHAVALPELRGGAPVQLGVLISASTTQVSVDGVPVQALVPGTDQRAEVPEHDLKGAFVVSLYDALLDKADLTGGSANARGRVLMQLDKALSPRLMRQLMYTAGQAQFSEMRLLGEDLSTQEISAKSVLLPVIGPSQTPEVSEYDLEKTFGPQLSVRLGASGFSLSADGHTVDAFGAGASKTRMTLACAESCTGLDSYPWDELTEVLSGFRSQFPAECAPAGRLWKARAPEYGYFPASCVLAIDLNGRLDLPWWWWLRLTGGYTIGAVPSDPVTAKPDLFPYWVLFSGPLEEEEEEEDVAYRYVATCQDTDCVSVAPLIQRDPRVPYVDIGDRVPDTVEISDALDDLPGSQSDLLE